MGLGIGGTYIYMSNGTLSDNIYGGRIFANFRPFPEVKGVKGLYAHVEGEYLNHTEVSSNNTLIRKFVPAVNLGVGYNTAFDKGFAFTVELLVNPVWFEQRKQGIPTVYNTPWQYRVGIYYAF